MKKNKIKDKNATNIIFMSVMGVFALIQVLLLLIPLCWAVIQSFNDAYHYVLNPFSLPSKLFDFSNYATAFKNLNITINSPSRGKVNFNIFNMTGFSFIIAFTRAFMSTLVTAFLAYALSKYRHWRICRIIYVVNIFVMIFPVIGSLPASLELNKAIGRYNNIVFFLLTGYTGTGMYLMMFYGAFKGLANDYKEAAMIDGAGHYTIMLKVYFPMILPLFASHFILGFMGAWNDYMTTVIWLPSYPNLAYGVFMFETLSDLNGNSTPELLAGFIIVAIPTAILWAFSQKMVSSKLAVGGLKG